MTILLTGGGTGGSVTPLLAVASKIKELDQESQFLFLGSFSGPERKMCQEAALPFKRIYSGKFRQYFSFQNFLDPFFIALGFFQAIYFLNKFKPNVVLSAGSYVAVPVVWAAAFLGIPRFIHQQDVEVGLANKLMRFFATKVTVSLEKSLKDFSTSKVILTGNPVRKIILRGKKEEALIFFNLKENFPTIFVLGGGTGALKINEMVSGVLSDLLSFCQIIHLTGKERRVAGFFHPGYHSFEFLGDKEIALAYAAADLVISRAGMGVLSEIALLGKPVIIIPIPQSHQEANAYYFEERKAGVVILQEKLTTNFLISTLKELLQNPQKLEELSAHIKEIMKKEADDLMAQEILKLKKI